MVSLVDKRGGCGRLFCIIREVGSVSLHRHMCPDREAKIPNQPDWNALSASAQYPGQVGGKSKDTVELRAIGVLEWTGKKVSRKRAGLCP